MVHYSSRLLLAVTAIFALSCSVHPIEGKLCGKRLSQTLALVCDLYPTLSPVGKRSNDIDVNDNSALVLKDWSNAEEQLEDMSYAGEFKITPSWMQALYPKDATVNFMAEDEVNEFVWDGYRPGKRGIVEECCYKSCTLGYLIKHYCATPSN